MQQSNNSYTRIDCPIVSLSHCLQIYMSENNSTMQFKIVTPDGVIYESNEVEKVTIPTMSGQITVLPNHSSIVSVLKPGELLVVKDGKVYGLAVSGGILEVRPSGEVIILADTAERAEDIDIDRAEEARKRAEALMKQQENVADVDFARLQASIEKELARISIGKKYKNVK